MSQSKQFRNSMKSFSLVFCCLAALCFASSRADEPAKGVTAKAEKRASTSALLPEFTPAREAVALEFVQTNHAELADLLAQLKQSKRDDYELAIRELFRNVDRLGVVQETNPKRYALDLEAWKVKSRIQLLAARASMTTDDSLHAKLREELALQADVKLRQLKLEREQMNERLLKLNASIEAAEKDRTAYIDRQFDMLLRNIAGSREKMKVNAKSKTK